MKSKQIWIILGVVAGLLVLVSILFPPRNPRETGSTFGRNPDGYGAWHAYIKKQGFSIKQLQRPEQRFLADPPAKPATLLRVYPTISDGFVSEGLQNWIKKGNNLVLLGIAAPATNAPFLSVFDTAQGPVTIETKRRLGDSNSRISSLGLEPTPLLADKDGMVAWETRLGRGKITFVVTPYLAANAYQNKPGNFAYLAHLVEAKTRPIVVDEYLHGYVEREELIENSDIRSWVAYLTQTPLVVILIQGVVVVLLLIWSHNRRFGKIITIKNPHPNNNLDYIDALSEVLFKAENYEFLVNKIAKAEQIHIQKKLGLGSASLPVKLVAESWQQQTKSNKGEIMAVWQPNRSVKGINPLFQWLKELAAVRSKLR